MLLARFGGALPILVAWHKWEWVLRPSCRPALLIACLVVPGDLYLSRATASGCPDGFMSSLEVCMASECATASTRRFLSLAGFRANTGVYRWIGGRGRWIEINVRSFE